MEQAILATGREGVVLVLALLLLQQVLRGKDVDSLARIGDLERPFDVVFVEAEFVHHVRNGSVDGILDLGSEPWWS